MAKAIIAKLVVIVAISGVTTVPPVIVLAKLKITVMAEDMVYRCCVKAEVERKTKFMTIVGTTLKWCWVYVAVWRSMKSRVIVGFMFHWAVMWLRVEVRLKRMFMVCCSM